MNITLNVICRTMHSPKARSAVAALFIALFFSTATAAPHTVEGSDITESEWQAWPSWCKAVFLASEWARSSIFQG